MNKDDKAKIIVGAVITFVIILMVIYGVVVFGDGNNKKKESSNVSFSAPKLEQKKYDYNKRLDVINAKGYKPEIKTDITDNSETLAEEEEEEPNPFLTEIEEKRKPPVQERNTEIKTQQKESIASVSTKPSYNQVQKKEPVVAASIQEPIKRRKKRYLDIDKTNNNTSSSFNVSESIPCRIYGDHKVTNYSKIKARITKDVNINGVKIKRNTIVTGIVRLSNSKVKINFETIQYQNQTIPANMKAYSRDGLEGIYIEGGVGDDVKKDAYDEIIDAASPSTVDNIPIVGDLIKSTTKKQNNKVYVDVPNDYTIYLKK